MRLVTTYKKKKMRSKILLTALLLLFTLSLSAFSQQKDSCTNLTDVNVSGVEITKAPRVEAGSTEPIPWSQSRTGLLPAYCRVDEVMNRRTGVGGEEFGITFALAMPDNWNGDFHMQGGGGSNGIVMPPLGLNAAEDTPTLIRGFSVLSNDTGHKSHHSNFDHADIRFTTKGETLYAIALGWPTDGKILIRSLAANSENYPRPIRKIELLGRNPKSSGCAERTASRSRYRMLRRANMRFRSGSSLAELSSPTLTNS